MKLTMTLTSWYYYNDVQITLSQYHRIIIRYMQWVQDQYNYYVLSQVFASTTFCLIIGSKNIKRWKNFDLNWFQLLNTDRYVYLFIIKMGQTRNSKKWTLIRILNFKIICYSLPKVTDLITFWHILRIICILVIKEPLKSIQGLNLLLPTQKN